ncbi:MAG: amidohydrolase family protein [Solirubrobacterales bacterium]|nr:amidohydrolase family protein [Solirubrobacterales bacterium]
MSVGAAGTVSQPAPERPRRPGGVAKVGVHAHYLPDDYRQALIDNGHSQPDGFPVRPSWSPEAHLAMMDRLQIGTAILSVSSPGVNFGGDPADWARRVNEAGAKTVREYRGRFGLFASLPLPDADAALSELAYAPDKLLADGVVLLTNYRGVYVGDERFERLFAELNRRKAVAFLHPTSPACFEATSLGYPRPLLEFLLDTTRAVANLVLTGTLKRYRDLRLIVPHSGSALPVIADRLADFSRLFSVGGQPAGAIDVTATLQNLYYEVGAGAPFPRQIAALLDLLDAGRLLYGTDFPFGAVEGIEATTAELETTRLLKPPELDHVLRGNSMSLFPRLVSS